MPRIRYVDMAFGTKRMAVVDQATEICEEYARQGFSLTLRQLYYQFVARGLLVNKQSEYKRLGEILNDARLAGLFDWNYLIDRTRNLVGLPTWSSPSELMQAAGQQFRTDRWADQPVRIEVWVEKDAAIGVINRTCNRNNIDYFSCRGYTSASELWAAHHRLKRYITGGQRVVILHLGDHDPSGLDMSRDIRERLRLFIADEEIDAELELRRIALNYDQVERYSPPPNPAKSTDARFARYVRETGLIDSWELDALEPAVVDQLIQDEVDGLRDSDVWAASTAVMESQREDLVAAAQRWPEVVAFLDGVR
jgi:hypothetical protein